MGPRHPQRLRLKHIEAKPKEVRFVGSRPDVRIVNISDETARDLVELRALIEAGTPVPSRYYRPSMNRRGDQLLAERGILHLHLKSVDDDAIVYMIQYDDHVIIICVDTHKHLRAVPPRANLRDDLINRAEKELLGELVVSPRQHMSDEADCDDG